MLFRLLVAGVLAAHGAVHLAFMAPVPPTRSAGPVWPFVVDRRVIADASHARGLAAGLALVTVVAFGVAAVSVAGLSPAAWYGPSTVVGAIASLALLALSRARMLILGVALDIALLLSVVAGGWSPTRLEP